MRCSYPIRLHSAIPARDGIVVPCGQCLACRLNYARMWSIRIMNEAKVHPASCFVTLTYDDAHLPENGTLVKSHLQDFLKKLRDKVGYGKLRFFASGEYGDRSFRPHYHLAVFGLSVSAADVAVIKSVWCFGFVSVDALEVDSANYIASYTVKKQKGKKAKEYYESKGIIPEFATMSLKPGIGATFLEKFGASLRTNGFCVAKGCKYKLPRYYEDKLFSEDEKGLRKLANEKFIGEQLLDDLHRSKVESKSLSRVRGERGIQQERNLKSRQVLKKRKL